MRGASETVFPYFYDHMRHIGSSNIWKVDYDRVKMEMTIIFLNRRTWIYTYSGVPIRVWTSFLKAESHGTYFSQNIKDNYKYKRTFTNGNSNL